MKEMKCPTSSSTLSDQYVDVEPDADRLRREHVRLRPQFTEVRVRVRDLVPGDILVHHESLWTVVDVDAGVMSLIDENDRRDTAMMKPDGFVVVLVRVFS